MINVPWWKRLLSHFTDIHLESLSSPVNEVIHLSMNRGRFMLSTNNAVYSYDDLYLNYSQTIDRWEYDKNKNYKVLMLGYGLGSVAYLLQKKKINVEHITAIEYDPSVVELASDYTIQRLKFPVDIIEADAQIWLDVDESKYDLIIMDIFVDITTPKSFRRNEFANKLKTHLNPGGTIMYNFLAQNETDVQLAKDYFNNVFKSYFPDGDLLKVHYNIMMINDKQQFDDKSEWIVI